jgi:hypothetical protein
MEFHSAAWNLAASSVLLFRPTDDEQHTFQRLCPKAYKRLKCVEFKKLVAPGGQKTDKSFFQRRFMLSVFSTNVIHYIFLIPSAVIPVMSIY